MHLERTHHGLEARIRPRGFGRFISAGFLGFWLCGWAIGEAFAHFLLLRGGWALWTGERPGQNAAPLQAVPSIAMGLFLIFWLSFWTLGGILAIRELLRLLWSEVRLVVAGDLTIHDRLGPFRFTKVIPRHDLLRIYSIPVKHRLLAETRDGPVDLATIPSAADRETLEKALIEELHLALVGREGAAPVPLPEGWSEIQDAEGSLALVSDPVIRRSQARVAWTLTTGVSCAALYMISKSVNHPEWWFLTGMVTLAAAFMTWGAWRLSMTRREWRLGSGRLTLRHRSGSAARDLFEAASLELVESADSDGDSWFTLNALAAAAGAGTSGSPAANAGLGDRHVKRRIAHAIDDPSVPRRLGAWLADKARVPFREQSLARRRAQEISALYSQLESKGRFGGWLARRLRGK
jgi:hypothetical protein